MSKEWYVIRLHDNFGIPYYARGKNSAVSGLPLANKYPCRATAHGVLNALNHKWRDGAIVVPVHEVTACVRK